MSRVARALRRVVAWLVREADLVESLIGLAVAAFVLVVVASALGHALGAW